MYTSLNLNTSKKKSTQKSSPLRICSSEKLEIVTEHEGAVIFYETRSNHLCDQVPSFLDIGARNSASLNVLKNFNADNTDSLPYSHNVLSLSWLHLLMLNSIREAHMGEP